MKGQLFHDIRGIITGETTASRRNQEMFQINGKRRGPSDVGEFQSTEREESAAVDC